MTGVAGEHLASCLRVANRCGAPAQSGVIAAPEGAAAFDRGMELTVGVEGRLPAPVLQSQPQPDTHGVQNVMLSAYVWVKVWIENHLVCDRGIDW